MNLYFDRRKIFLCFCKYSLLWHVVKLIKTVWSLWGLSLSFGETRAAFGLGLVLSHCWVLNLLLMNCEVLFVVPGRNTHCPQACVNPLDHSLCLFGEFFPWTQIASSHASAGQYLAEYSGGLLPLSEFSLPWEFWVLLNFQLCFFNSGSVRLPGFSSLLYSLDALSRG